VKRVGHHLVLPSSGSAERGKPYDDPVGEESEVGRIAGVAVDRDVEAASRDRQLLASADAPEEGRTVAGGRRELAAVGGERDLVDGLDVAREGDRLRAAREIEHAHGAVADPVGEHRTVGRERHGRERVANDPPQDPVRSEGAWIKQGNRSVHEPCGTVRAGRDGEPRAVRAEGDRPHGAVQVGGREHPSGGRVEQRYARVAADGQAATVRAQCHDVEGELTADAANRADRRRRTALSQPPCPVRPQVPANDSPLIAGEIQHRPIGAERKIPHVPQTVAGQPDRTGRRVQNDDATVGGHG
jgi:hypothetical protein